MPGPSSPRGDGWTPRNGDSDSWGPSTAVQGGSTRRAGRAADDGIPDARRADHRGGADPAAFAGRGASDRGSRPASDQRGSRPAFDDWSPAGPAPRQQQKANRATERSVRDLDAQQERTQRPPERGVPWWFALAVLIVIAAIGGIVDIVGSLNARGGFNIGIVVASVVAVLIVRRSHMFPVVIAPPIVYSLGAAFELYLRSNGLANRRAVLDAAANYLVYGFPAIAAASAAVLIIAGIRLMVRK